MPRIESLLQPLLIWRQIILLYALLLGLEGPALLLAAFRYRRPRMERLVVLAPVAVFCALLIVARALSDTYAYWSTYAVWEVAHTPGNLLITMLSETARDASPSVHGATQLGIGLAVLTAALLVGGWTLVIRWQASSLPRSKRSPTAPTAPATVATEDAGNLEITVEPILHAHTARAILDEPAQEGVS